MAKFEVCGVEGINCELNLFSIIAYFKTKVQKNFSEWTATMAHDPSSLSEVEHKTSKFAQTIAGLLTAAVFAQAQVTESVEQCVQDRHPCQESQDQEDRLAVGTDPLLAKGVRK